MGDDMDPIQVNLFNMTPIAPSRYDMDCEINRIHGAHIKSLNEYIDNAVQQPECNYIVITLETLPLIEYVRIMLKHRGLHIYYGCTICRIDIEPNIHCEIFILYWGSCGLNSDQVNCIIAPHREKMTQLINERCERKHVYFSGLRADAGTFYPGHQ